MDQPDVLRLAILGQGRMGREVERWAEEYGFDVVARFDRSNVVATSPPLDFHVAIEFTTPSTAFDNVTALLQRHRPVVVGTTGWHDRLDELNPWIEQYDGRVVYGSNFSIGVLTFTRIVQEAARLFNGIYGYDAAVHEIHHTAKSDAPSGTALAIARTMLAQLEGKTSIFTETQHGRIDETALHVTSQRLGTTVGTHSVSFDSEADSIELIHRAKSRAGFAIGALLAAKWIIDQPPGLYRFEEVF